MHTSSIIVATSCLDASLLRLLNSSSNVRVNFTDAFVATDAAIENYTLITLLADTSFYDTRYKYAISTCYIA